jgi:cytochrome c553
MELISDRIGNVSTENFFAKQADQAGVPNGGSQMSLCTASTSHSNRCQIDPYQPGRYSWTKWVLVPILLLPLAGTSFADPSPEKGKAISGQCAACHGNLGRAVNTSYPNLAGQNYQYLVQTLEKFKNGQRRDSIMRSIATGLSEEQISDLAAFYAHIPKVDCNQQ